MRCYWRACFLLMGLLLLALPSWAGMGRGGPGRTRSPRGRFDGEDTREDSRDKKPNSYLVIQSGDPEGAVTFEAILHSELKARIADLPTVYQDALKEWTLLKKEAEKAGEKFTRPKPVKPFVQDYMDRVYPSLEPAQAAAQKCQEKWDKELAKRPDKVAAKKGDDAPASKGEDNKAAADPPPAK